MLYDFLRKLLEDHVGGAVFECFNIWHFIYMFLIFGGTILTIVLLKNKPQEIKNKAINLTISIAFGLYMADFFLMPFAYGEIDLEKLPFHMCTATCVLCFLSRHTKFFSKYHFYRKRLDWKNTLADLSRKIFHSAVFFRTGNR